ncbi:N-acetylglucosamine-1-phosphotransferase subunits alpha/beta-like [Homarus americanus]|uniref:N-acetylglucosamine-1-phosphotransferase subunits alpha/beta-like n=1 Tax=Homarus americanus TaxID=6706 RepID=A0A8J5JLH5_HOMAM|nr:N-acetylglucosamine-1-phosphotransferase subunits alpha/beta-like [Homarus americanus]KAG7159870.1 N-acetylglucosamine-1-phosphotransferase subunits alpha/beta-like [Homarus americanus]
MHRLNKLCQRWVLDAVLTHPPPLVAVVLTIFFSVFAVGFWCAHWLDQVDLAAYRSLNVFSDNIKNENLLEKMSSGLPIDVVYTWVNGSDPILLEGLKSLSVAKEDESCSLSHCLPAPYISLLDSPLSKAVIELIPSVIEVAHMLITHNRHPHNFTLIRVAEMTSIPQVLEKLSRAAGNGSQPKQAYWTSDVGGGWGMKQQHAVLVTGGGNIPHKNLLTSLFPQQAAITSTCNVSGSSSVHLLECKEEGLITYLLMSKAHTEILPDTVIKIRQAMLMLQPDREDHMKIIDANRFEDNEELRYSLRSLEKYAPWVRRIFLVTNGQIPYWLNLDHPRLTIITHEEIFTNISHLPTFSSPAIESHIHKIPGLSEHFLYLNDDVMLGSVVWPEDFYSPASGYKVYLSWSLPECSSGCPGSWLGDGYCDTSCNTTACEWDGGDCMGEKGEGDLLDFGDEYGVDVSVEFCAPSCSDLWLADKYCDQSCNIQACGFDGGDCGLDEIKELYSLPAPTSYNVTYVLPMGVSVAWLNVSSLLASGKAIEGWHSEHRGLRSIALNVAQGVLFIILKTNITATLKIELDIKNKNQEEKSDKKRDLVKYVLTMKCNTYPADKNATTKPEHKITSKHTVNFKNFTFHQVAPKLKVNESVQIKPSGMKYALVNVNASGLPESLVTKVHVLETMYKNGELTLMGLNKKKSDLIEKFLKTSSNPKLVYHQKSEWFKKEILYHSEMKVKNDSSLKNEDLKLNDKNNNKRPLVLPKIHSETSNASKKTASRSLLWADRNEPHDVEQLNVDKDKQTNLLSPQRTMENNILKPVTQGVTKDNGSLATYKGKFPWEKQEVFKDVTSITMREPGDYAVPHVGHRRLLDMFAESLLHVNRLYNSEYGYQARRVPAHMPHLISKKIMENLQDRFKEEYQLTSFHKIRQANDMQYAFSYFFFLMSEKITRTPAEVFAVFDTDDSGTLSDREIRTLMTHLNDLPLHYSTLQALHQVIKNCSATHHIEQVPTPIYERYADSDLSTVSLDLVLKCEPLTTLLKKLEKVHKYKYNHQSDDVIHFKMVTSNVSIVVHMLDEVRKNPRKFICLNSNLDPRSKENDLIHALVQDTYESLFPVPSSFELPINYRNRFLYVQELHAWRKWRDLIRALIYACLASLIFLTLINFFSSELEGIRRRWCRKRRRRDGFGGVRV